MRVISEYTLMLKDTELIDFSLETEDGTENGLSKKLERVHINKIYDNSEMILPIPLFCELSDDSLMSWLMNRRVPPTRHNADKLLVSIGASESLARFVAATLMLSLNDAYWTRPHGAAMRWQDVSLFSAPFDERISYTAFTGELKKIYASGRVVSPEFTTNGTLKKFWRRCDDGIIELVKGDALFGGDMSRSQAVNEYFAAELAEAMGMDADASEAFLQTVEHYNELVAQGCDTDYGKEAYRALHAYLCAPHGDRELCMAGFILKNTLSDNGGVTRGLCRVDGDGFLTEVVETSDIVRVPGGAAVQGQPVDGDGYVSMNMWGFPSAAFMDVLSENFARFFEEDVPQNPLKAEYLLPVLIGRLLKESAVRVRVLHTSDVWYGVTYAEDRAAVANSIEAHVRSGMYAAELYGDLGTREQE